MKSVEFIKMLLQVIYLPLKYVLTVGLIFYSIFTFSMITTYAPHMIIIKIIDLEDTYKITATNLLVYIETASNHITKLPINDENDKLSINFKDENISISIAKAANITDKNFYDDGSFSVECEKIGSDSPDNVNFKLVLNIKSNQCLTILKSGKYTIETIKDIKSQSKKLRKLSRWYEVYAPDPSINKESQS